jgi:oligopeptide/dipeptide ABC transporter ATP-binding protein
VVADLVDDVAVMYAGSVVECAPVANLFAAPAHPYTQGLLRAMPSLERKQRRLPTIEGTVPSPAAMPSGCRFHPRCDLARTICRDHRPPLIGLPECSAACWALTDFNLTIAQADAA